MDTQFTEQSELRLEREVWVSEWVLGVRSRGEKFDARCRVLCLVEGVSCSEEIIRSYLIWLKPWSLGKIFLVLLQFWNLCQNLSNVYQLSPTLWIITIFSACVVTLNGPGDAFWKYLFTPTERSNLGSVAPHGVNTHFVRIRRFLGKG